MGAPESPADALAAGPVAEATARRLQELGEAYSPLGRARWGPCGKSTGRDARDWRVRSDAFGGLPPRSVVALRVAVFAQQLGDPHPAHRHLIELLHERELAGQQPSRSGCAPPVTAADLSGGDSGVAAQADDFTTRSRRAVGWRIFAQLGDDECSAPLWVHHQTRPDDSAADWPGLELTARCLFHQHEAPDVECACGV